MDTLNGLKLGGYLSKGDKFQDIRMCSMKAAYYEDFGKARECFKIGNFPIRDPKADEVLVKIYASGINHSDTKIRAGNRGKMVYPFVIPHNDGAGVIEKVGANVPKERIGQKVWLYNACWRRQFGTAAGYITLPTNLAVPLPDGTEFAEAACLGVPALTAYAALTAFGSIKNKYVLITGGAGSVGNYAIQMAKNMGAKVVTTVSSKEKARLAELAGADLIINYIEENVINKVKEYTSNYGINHIVDVELGGNLPITKEITAPYATISSYGSASIPEPTIPFYPLMFKNIAMRFVFVYDLQERVITEAINAITEYLETRTLITNIAKIYQIDEIAVAHEIVENGKAIGNVVIEVN
jgi:NADPH2:quinone reductase